MPSCPVLSGGPYHMHVIVVDKPMPPELRFPAEPLLDMHGVPSVCAPRPVPDGPVVYVNTGGVNIVGDPIFKYRAASTAR